ncbi:hypothetical protein, partial [Curtobacterium sp. MCBA15_003]
EPTAEPTPTEIPSAEPTAPAVLPDDLKTLAAPLESSSQALAADASGSISALRVDDTTTYFTPQPTAAVRAVAASTSLTEATTTGVRVQGSGFAPYETVTAAIGDEADATVIPGVQFTADADGNVSGSIVLPADLVDAAGTYALGLVGLSSAQSATTAIVITADAGTAPVAVPVPGTAAFTG